MPFRKKSRGSTRRTVDPSTASMVPISIRKGCTGHVAYPGLGLLNDTTRIMDVSMTWSEAFRTHYGVNVPDNFVVQRAPHYDGPQNVVKKHTLQSEIRDVILEFQKMRNPFVVYVMDARLLGRRGGRLSNLSKSSQNRSSSWVDEDEESENEDGSPPNLQPVVAPRPIMSQTVSNPTPRGSKSVLETIRGKNFARRGLDLNKSADSAVASTSRVANPITARASMSSVTSMLGLGGRGNSSTVTMNGSGSSSPRGSRVNMGAKRSSTSQLSSPPNQRPRFSEERLPPASSNETHSHLGERDDDEEDEENEYEDNEDARSDITDASQDSQLEDLADMGISFEELKAAFCKKAQKNFSNTQFLKAKHELEELKRNYGSRWAKWTTYAPTTANIIRDLLDV